MTADLRLVGLLCPVPYSNDPDCFLLHSIEEPVGGYNDLSEGKVRKLAKPPLSVDP
jgi:hypothetical protein